MSDMITIREEDLIESVADALQYISYYHPMDYIRALGEAYKVEQGPAAKDAIAQILTNSRMCAEGHRPICQDTGIVNVFVRWGQNCRLDSERSLQEVVDEGVRKAYTHPENKLRASILADPAFTRRNTRDNTPSVLSVEMVPGDKVSIDVAAKGGGSENKSKFKMMNPSDNIVDWVIEQIPSMGAGWCPPGMLGIGIGGTAEHCMKLAKQSLMDPIDMAQLKLRGAQNDIEQLRIDIFDAVNAQGVGAQGLGGLSTVLDVKIYDAPCHAAGKPVAMIPNCAATRHAHFTLDGSGPTYLEQPKLDEWPDVNWAPDAAAKRVNLDTLTQEEVASWEHGDRILLSGKMLTGRDAAHKRIQDMLAKGEELPVNFRGRAIYYVGPVDPVMGEAVGPAGPTTATRMDKFTEMMLDLGLLAMIGKAERGADAVDVISRFKVAYLMATGGAAYLVSRAIKEAKVVGFEDLGMEAIYEFTVENMPVTVAVDSAGNNVHTLAPAHWKKRIAEEDLLA
ncbi:fumarate hydratase [Pontixanthobacter gangjinensis]|uniref:Fumarate hydratase class I n=1 Tax=Pontixanthobacter gangjinensis TaxID=1028742 RepID=A0A6I4SJW7_9SPHN|nr:fumarate hydratase [Pontixanthobacter gangjinensis]MXO55728.1 fumarate hydratase [Pontixanthobacter gangjinensis]